MKRILLGFGLAAALANSASGADLMVMAPAPVMMTDAGFDWSGFYAGLNAGYGTGNSRSVGTVSGIVDNIALNGGMLGVTLGANTQLSGNFVLGVEGDVAWADLSGSAACNAAPALTCSANLNWIGTIEARAGVAVDRVLFFATAGLAAAGAKASVNPAVAGSTGTFNGTGYGWTVGAGVEAALTDAISAKVEYNYLNLGGLQAPVGTLGAVNAYDITATAHTIKAGLNFHF